MSGNQDDDFAPARGMTETSRLAAEAMAPFLRYVAVRIRETIAEHGPMTADEVAAQIGESIISVRPRVSDLVKRGVLKDSGLRGVNTSGYKAAKWILV